MASANEVYVKISAKDATAKGIGSAERKLNSFGAQAKKIGAAFAGVFAVREMLRFGKEAANLYNIQAQAEQQLLVALKGRSDIQQRLIKQAGELQGETLFGDEETIQAQALIAAFVKEEAALKRIIPLVQDMASAKNMSLAGSADLVAKTLGSSTNAMSRYGIEVHGAVGSVERLESLVKALNDAFGGQAAAAAQVGTGAITQMQNAIGDLKEEIGELLVAGDGFSAWVQGSTKEISQWATIIGDDSRGGFKNFLLFLTGSKTKWSEVAAEIEKNNKAQQDLNGVFSDYEKMYNDARSGGKKPLTPVEPIITVRLHIEDLNTQVAELQKTFQDPNISFEAAQQAFKDAAKLKTEIAGLQKILDFGKVRPDAPEKMKSIAAAPIDGLAMPSTVGTGADMQAATDQAKEKLRVMYAELQDEINALNEQFNFALVDGLVGGLEAAIGGASFGGVMKALLTPLGQLLEEQGKMMLVSGFGLVALKAGFSNPITGGPALIAAGALLVGAAQGIKSLGNAGGGGGGGGGFSGATAGGGGGGYQPSRRGDKQAVDVSGKFEIEGDKLVYVIDQANQKSGHLNA